MSNLSIVIPVFNEEKHIVNLLHHLKNNASKQYKIEIIIVDGGSTDATAPLVIEAKKDIDNQFVSMRYLKADKGRAKQMNAGAKVSQASVLYFLHADSYPPKQFDRLIIDAVKSNKLAGCFKMKFDSSHLWLKLAGWLTQFSWQSSRGGDQSQYITKNLFEEVGGFNEACIIYEDNDLIAKLYAKNQFHVIQKWLITSARCYEKHGVFRLQKHYWTIHLKKWLGATPQELNAYYFKHVSTKQ